MKRAGDVMQEMTAGGKWRPKGGRKRPREVEFLVRYIGATAEQARNVVACGVDVENADVDCLRLMVRGL